MRSWPARVLMTADAVGGVWTYARDLAEGLAARGVEVTVAVLGPGGHHNHHGNPHFRTIAAPEVTLDWLAASPDDVHAAGARVVELAHAVGADLVHLNSPALAAEAAFRLPVVGVCHSDVATWWAAVKGGPLPDDLAWRAGLTGRGYAACDALLAPTAAFAEATAATYGLTRAPTVVWNGRATPPASGTGSDAEPFVFTCGRLWDEGKGAAVLDRAAAALAAPVFAAGARQGPGAGRVGFEHLIPLGALPAGEIARWQAEAAVFASPALYEPFGLAVLEAAQAGTALALCREVGFRGDEDGAGAVGHPDLPGAVERRGRLHAAGRRGRPCGGACAVAGRPRRAGAPGRRGRGLGGALHGGRHGGGDAGGLPRAVAPEGGGVRVVYFTHSLQSCWNHGNAHFLRGVLRELAARGHAVAAFEPEGAWSLENLLRDHGPAGLDAWREAYPELRTQVFATEAQAEAACDGADLVIVHEWNDPALVAAVGALRTRGGGFTLLFHDTHHRAVSDPDAIRAFDLSGYDGVLAFGEALSEVYRRWGWSGRVWTWHEAADIRLFHPPATPQPRQGLVWIGNWGDEERSAELETFLFRPAHAIGLRLNVHGVRYSEEALATLARYGAHYLGWLPNARAPEVFARRLATVHVPRRFYTTVLPGVPTIRVFEALACGIPLASAPWSDAEGLFRPGQDYLTARDGAEMEGHLAALRDDAHLRAALAASGLETIRARHTCAHRVDELLAVVAGLKGSAGLQPAGAQDARGPRLETTA